MYGLRPSARLFDDYSQIMDASTDDYAGNSEGMFVAIKYGASTSHLRADVNRVHIGNPTHVEGRFKPSCIEKMPDSNNIAGAFRTSSFVSNNPTDVDCKDCLKIAGIE